MSFAWEPEAFSGGERFDSARGETLGLRCRRRDRLAPGAWQTGRSALVCACQTAFVTMRAGRWAAVASTGRGERHGQGLLRGWVWGG